jgi:biopolymer transport protein ExbD
MRLEMVNKPLARVSSPALLSVAMVLLMFLLLGSGYVAVPGVAVQMPAVSAGVAPPEQATIIAVSKNGTLFLQGMPVSAESLPAKLASVLKGKPDRTVQLRTDRNAPLGQTLHLLEIARSAGATRLTIGTEPARE